MILNHLIRLENIKHIEIYRGGLSARYGEGAFGGVINIVTEEVFPVPL